MDVRRKTETRSAVQFDPAVLPWPEGVKEIPAKYVIDTDAGSMYLTKGDVILSNGDGPPSKVTAEEFIKDYEEVQKIGEVS